MKYLIELLEKESDIYGNYLQLALQKKQALIDNNIDIIEQITDQEKALSSKILALEAARTEFLREQGFAGSISLKDLLPQLAEEDRTQVQACADNLKEVLTQCKKFTDSNMSLLKQSSNYINHMIKVFSSSLNGGSPATYTKGNQKQLAAGQIADMQA